jgi:hypothetical protein
MRDCLVTEFDDHMNDAQIEPPLLMSTNKDSASYAKFVRNDQVSNAHKASQ